MLLAAHAPGVPVLVGPDRAWWGCARSPPSASTCWCSTTACSTTGWRATSRWCAFDGSGLGNGHLLPRGPLREPLSALRGADALLVVDGPLPLADDDAIAAHAAPRALVRRRARRPVSLATARGRRRGAARSSSRGLAVGLLSGIARPASLAPQRRSARRDGGRRAQLSRSPPLPRARPARSRARSPLWITTEKDALKILPRWAHGADLRVLAIEPRSRGRGDAFVDWLERRCARSGASRRARAPIAERVERDAAALGAAAAPAAHRVARRSPRA